MEVARTFSFSAAHRLPMVPPQHKCHGLHGHNFDVEVVCRGEVSKLTGFVIDFAMIDVAWQETCFKVLDHKYLNEIEGLQCPTSEVLATWIFARLHTNLKGLLYSVSVSETGRSRATYVP